MMTVTEVMNRTGVRDSATIYKWIENGWLQAEEDDSKDDRCKYLIPNANFFKFTSHIHHWIEDFDKTHKDPLTSKEVAEFEHVTVSAINHRRVYNKDFDDIFLLPLGEAERKGRQPNKIDKNKYLKYVKNNRFSVNYVRKAFIDFVEKPKKEVKVVEMAEEPKTSTIDISPKKDLVTFVPTKVITMDVDNVKKHDSSLKELADSLMSKSVTTPIENESEEDKILKLVKEIQAQKKELETILQKAEELETHLNEKKTELNKVVADFIKK